MDTDTAISLKHQTVTYTICSALKQRSLLHKPVHLNGKSFQAKYGDKLEIWWRAKNMVVKSELINPLNT